MAAAIVLGVLVALLAQFLAVIIIGPGEGWYQPVLFSPVLFLIYPLVLVRFLAPRKLPWGGADIVLLAAAILLDILLVKATEAEGVAYFHRVMAHPPYAHVWLFLWFLWQALTVKLVVDAVRRGRR